MNFHKSICTEQGYSIMLTIILSLRIWFGKKLFIKVLTEFKIWLTAQPQHRDTIFNDS